MMNSKLLRLCLWSILFVVVIGCKRANDESTVQPNAIQFEDGDILFQDLDCGPFCDAIEKVTVGYKGANLSHVGMVVNTESGNTQVIEANGNGVIFTHLDTFLQRQLDDKGNPKVIHARLNSDYGKLIPTAIKESKALLGKPYDEVFDINNDSYYCSELIYWAFKNANGGTPLFELKPMTFIDPDTDKTFTIWEDYYEDLGVSIPEGLPGLNPGGMSTAASIDILRVLGGVSGKSGVVKN